MNFYKNHLVFFAYCNLTSNSPRDFQLFQKLTAAAEFFNTVSSSEVYVRTSTYDLGTEIVSWQEHQWYFVKDYWSNLFRYNYLHIGKGVGFEVFKVGRVSSIMSIASIFSLWMKSGRGISHLGPYIRNFVASKQNKKRSSALPNIIGL